MEEKEAKRTIRSYDIYFFYGNTKFQLLIPDVFKRYGQITAFKSAKICGETTGVHKVDELRLQTLMPIYSKVPLRKLKELAEELLQLLMLTSMKLSNTGKLLKK